MENASKALLIAAAVLIVILLIAFGMSVFNSTGSVTDDVDVIGTELENGTNKAANSVVNILQGLNK